MNIYKIIFLYLFPMFLFILFDFLWLGILAKDFYSRYLSHFLAPRFHIPSAVIFYLIYIAGVVVLVLIPAIERQSVTTVFIHGLLFGLCAYAAYNLTNFATLKDWPIIITITDLIWGTFVTTVVSVFSFLVYTKIFG